MLNQVESGKCVGDVAFAFNLSTMWTGFFLVVLLQCCRSDNCETLTKICNIHFQISLVFSGSSPGFFNVFWGFFWRGEGLHLSAEISTLYIVQWKETLENTNHHLKNGKGTKRNKSELAFPHCIIFSFHRDVGKWS